MKFIHTADGPAPTQAEVAFFEQAGHKLAAGMQEGSTRRSFETVGSTSAYLVAGVPGLVNIHTVKDDPKTSLASLIAIVPNTYGPTFTPPDFVAGYINNGGRYKNVADPETDCLIPQLTTEPTIHTEYVSPEFAARKLAAVGGKLYGAAAYPPADDPERNILYTQAARKRPGYFTGMMAALVQMLLGAGRFIGPSVYKQAAASKKVKNPLGGMQMGFDSRTGKMSEPPNPSAFQYMKPFEEGKCVGTQNTSHPFAMEVPWDYRWHRTHGLVRGLDENNKPLMFIVEISNAGIFAYPVQVDPFTKYTRVQKYMKEVYPWMDEPVFAGMDVFDAFGGIPLPTYYTAGDRDAAVTKMKVARIGDAGAFYAGTFMSTMFGWAFSESTSEAANICVTTDPDGYNRANLFKIKIKGLRLTKAQDENGKDILAIQGSATCVNTKSGVFHHAGRPPRDPCMPSGVPQFHIYEPVINQVISYDLRYGFAPTKARKCDAPIFCSYIKDDLHILYYYADQTKQPIDRVQDTREECQVVGTWTSSVVYGAIKTGYFYNTTTDLRREIKMGGSSVTTTKEWAAFDYDMHSQVDFFSMLCVSTHYFYNHHSSKYETHSGEGWAVNVGTSSTDRSVYFSGSLYTKANGSKGYGQGITYAGSGPQIRWSAFYYFITHWSGGAGLAPSNKCMEPDDDFVEIVPSCHKGETESLVGKVKHYTLIAGGYETCGYWGGANATGGYYTGKGGLGNWFAMGEYNTAEKAAQRPPQIYPDPYLDTFELVGGHEAVFQVHVFGLPLANGKMIHESKATAPATEEGFGLEFAPDWFRFSLPQCPVPTMPVCQNFYGRDAASFFIDRSHGATVNIGQSVGIHPEAIPVGGIMK